MADHDHVYKLLFSHPEMVRDLLEGFVKEEWLDQRDYGSLEKVPSSYVSDDLRERSDDVVWRVRWGEQWIYIYLLIEFQSTVEPYMAVRIHTYVGLLYQDLIRTRQLSTNCRLPPVLTIVLYNGAVRWSAPEALRALIQPGPRALERFQPQARYLHFHADYQGEYASFTFDGDVLAGALRSRTARRLIRKWALARRDALEANWARARACEPLLWIAPLE